MKRLKPTLVTAITIGLLAGSMVGVAAQEGTDDSAPDDGTTTPGCVVTEGTDTSDAECVEAESVVAPLPVADYWVEWANHKEASPRAG